MRSSTAVKFLGAMMGPADIGSVQVASSLKPFSSASPPRAPNSKAAPTACLPQSARASRGFGSTVRKSQTFYYRSTVPDRGVTDLFDEILGL